MTKQIPMLDLQLEYQYMKSDIDTAIKKCLDHQKWILGPEVEALENKIAKYLGVKHCIGASSGTEALVLSLRALAIKLKGREYFDKTDEIITTPFTFTATGDAILRAGATPVFVDIDDTCNIDPKKIQEYLMSSGGKKARTSAIATAQSSKHISSGTKVVGVLPVHLYGQSCNMDEIMKIAKEYNLFVLEDVAQAFGGTWNGNKLGSIGTTGAYSFFPSKNLGGFGDGGMVSTNDDEVGELVRMLLKHGGKDKYNVEHIGYNARLDTLQAAILLAKFGYIEEFNNRRIKVAGIYNRELAGIEGLLLPVADAGHIFHQYTVRVKNGKRDALQGYLKGNGVSSMVYYPFPLHKMKVFGDGRSIAYSNLSNAEQASNSVVSLPMEPLQSEMDTAHVVSTTREFFKT